MSDLYIEEMSQKRNGVGGIPASLHFLLVHVADRTALETDPRWDVN